MLHAACFSLILTRLCSTLFGSSALHRFASSFGEAAHSLAMIETMTSDAAAAACCPNLKKLMLCPDGKK
jgi:hypothetical protein